MTYFWIDFSIPESQKIQGVVLPLSKNVRNFTKNVRTKAVNVLGVLR